MKRLTTESSLKPLVAQFVPIKIDVASDDYKIWRRDHKPEKGAIPQMYIIRADGEELYNKVGGLPADQLQQVLSSALKGSGAILSDSQAAEVEKVTQASKELIKSGSTQSAIKEIAKIPAALNTTVVCYAKPVMELREVVGEIVKLAQEDLTLLTDDIKDLSQDSDNEVKIRLANRIVDAQTEFAKFKPLSKDIQGLNRSIRGDKALDSMVSDIKKFRSLKKARTPSTTRLGELLSKYEGTSLGNQISVVLKSAEKTSKAAWIGFKDTATRTWTSKGGGYTIEAEPVSASDKEIKLKTTAGKEITVKFSSLSSEDNEWIKNNLKK